MPQDEREQAAVYHDPARMTPDISKMSDDELAIMFRNRETTGAADVGTMDAQSKAQAPAASREGSRRLFVRGASDGLVSARISGGLRRLLPKARTLTIPAAGHAPHLEQPQAFASAVLEFLERLT